MPVASSSGALAVVVGMDAVSKPSSPRRGPWARIGAVDVTELLDGPIRRVAAISATAIAAAVGWR